ncbi:hypothetical protein [Bradyrhizobium genosp. P]|uniref:hypothetical protein n=1 Tax=Bradyrhizobium genosp. P TaxID=83641 RepID=UPI003CEE5717
MTQADSKNIISLPAEAADTRTEVIEVYIGRDQNGALVGEFRPNATGLARRAFLTAAAMAVPTVAIAPTTALAALAAVAPDRRAAHAYAAWLHMERRILRSELWPDLGTMAEMFVSFDNAGANWHLRHDDWKSDPQPSSRAAAVLDLVGVDWRSDDGKDHVDSGRRPPLPGGWPRVDAELIELAAKIEPLIQEFYARHFEWGLRSAEVDAELDERFGEDARTSWTSMERQ